MKTLVSCCAMQCDIFPVLQMFTMNLYVKLYELRSNSVSLVLEFDCKLSGFVREVCGCGWPYRGGHNCELNGKVYCGAAGGGGGHTTVNFLQGLSICSVLMERCNFEGKKKNICLLHTYGQVMG